MNDSDRAALETDADTVEAVAKAITGIWNKPSPNSTAFPASAETLARAAIAAMPSSADDNWLDDLPAKAWVNVQCNSAECIAVIQMPGDLGEYMGKWITGTGPTRRAAVLDAVAKAKEASNAS